MDKRELVRKIEGISKYWSDKHKMDWYSYSNQDLEMFYSTLLEHIIKFPFHTVKVGNSIFFLGLN